MLRRVALVVASCAAACSLSSAEPSTPDYHEDGSEPLGAARSSLEEGDPVSAAVLDKSCTTAVVKGLSTQLVDQIQCLRPGTFATIEGAPGLSLGSAVFPWLQTPAQAALLAAQKDRGATMSINSALRTLPQQYLLYRWYKTGRCGIGLAAQPGKSNHEEGLAVDIQDNASWREAMKAHTFVWLGSSDPVHFDFKGEGAADIGGLSVLAFQKLWNLNHPEDRIDEDSAYGPETEDRLTRSPVGGFPKGVSCDTDAGAPPPPPPPSDAGVDAAEAPSGEERTEDEPDGCAADCAVGRRTSGGAWAAALTIAAGLTFLGRRRRPLLGRR
jgi:hypothetical protein